MPIKDSKPELNSRPYPTIAPIAARKVRCSSAPSRRRRRNAGVPSMVVITGFTIEGVINPALCQ